MTWILLIAMTLCGAPAGASSGALLVLPVFLNGNETYLRTGTAGLASLAADAAREASGADVAILPADAFGGSLRAGEVVRSEMNAAIAPGQELVITRCSVEELVRLLNDTMLYGSDSFPHLSGIEVRAGRVLSDSGQYRAQVTSIRQGQNVIASRKDANFSDPLYELSSEPLTVVTTRGMEAAEKWIDRRSQDAGTDLQDAFVDYVRPMPDESIEYYAQMRRLVVISDTIDTELALEELGAQIPADVHVDTWRPGIVADTIMFSLRGQDRQLSAHIWGDAVPYSLSISGLAVDMPTSVDLDVRISQTVPAARKTANTFDDDTIFVDLRQNASIPEDTVLTLDVGEIYPSETVLHVYHYEENGDIVPNDVSCIVDAAGSISFPVRPSMTYVVNSQELDHSTLFGSPTRMDPFVPGIVLILLLFTVWVVLFVARKRHGARQPSAD